MNAPQAGGPVRGSSSGRPIMVALDFLGRRGALRILWELREQPMTFRTLQQACESNPASLNTRLKELRELRIVEHEDGGYRLTKHGQELSIILRALNSWADDWAATSSDAEIP